MRPGVALRGHASIEELLARFRNEYADLKRFERRQGHDEGARRQRAPVATKGKGRREIGATWSEAHQQHVLGRASPSSCGQCRDIEWNTAGHLGRLRFMNSRVIVAPLAKREGLVCFLFSSF